MEDEAERSRQEGPLRGRCPKCGTPASGRSDWVELEPSHDRVTLVLGAHQRHQLVELLRDYLDDVSRRVAEGELERAPEWMLRPLWRFEGEGTVTGVHKVEVEEEREDTAPRAVSRAGSGARSRARSPTAGIPKLVGLQAWPREESSDETPTTYVAALSMDAGATDDEELVTITLDLSTEARALWGQAALQVRPIHLREHGYPLIGVRLVASYLGRMALIDGLVDVGSEMAPQVFASLSRRFRVQLVFGGGGDSSAMIRREVSARDLERNAALAFESARAALARSEYPREAFVQALESLRGTALEDRLEGAEHTLVSGAYRHLISPRETWVALEHLESASDKRNLAHLLEVEGLSVDEYEAIRKRVLVASVEHGLCAPRRFWRRAIASGLANDANDYAQRLARARARAEADPDADDLDAEQRGAAWARIAEFCDLKQLEYPPELAAQIGQHGRAQPRRRGDSSRDRSAAGEINARDTNVGGLGNLRDQLRDPSIRLRAATAALSNGGSPEAIETVFEGLDEFDEEELLALMPSLAELGTQAIPWLHAKLESPRQQVRQASAILVGIAQDSSSIVPLLRRLAREETRVWFDVARAIGSLGGQALDRLCALGRQSARGEQFPIEHRELIARIGRAMAEVIIADGGPQGITHDTVEVLSQSNEPDIAVAAGRALATLHDVSVAGAQIRGERSLPHITQLRGFARRAYEAILVPELDILDEEVEAEFL